MELKPAKGLRVKVNARREAVFGEEAVSVKNVQLPDDGSNNGVLTGAALAGYCEVEMSQIDGRRHWYPVDSLVGEKGEKIVEEEIAVEDPGDDAEE